MLFPLETEQFVTTKRKGEEKKKETPLILEEINFLSRQLEGGGAVMCFRVGTSAIRPTYQIHGIDIKT
jgi:hypothetical protein